MASSSARESLREPGTPLNEKRPAPIRRTSSRAASQAREHSPIQLPPSASNSSIAREQDSSLASPPLEPLRPVSGIEGRPMESKGGIPAYNKKDEDNQRRPLIDYVTNEWRNNPKYSQPSAAERKDAGYGLVIRSPKFRRYIFVYSVLLLFGWLGWKSWLRPKWQEEALLAKSLDRTDEIRKSWFGVNARPPFADMIQVKTLDEKLVPSVGKGDVADKDKEKRLIIIGDVHGCKDELLKLLDKLSFRRDLDHLIMTGDMISKGPDSPGVIDLLMDLKASCVRGNHEDRVLLAHKDIHSKHIPLPGPEEDPFTLQDDMEEQSFSHGDYKDRAIARQLDSKQINFLRECPLVLQVGQIGGMGEVLVVHAGLVPGVDLEKQDPYNVMNMRTIDLETHVPSQDRFGMPWAKLWNHYQSRQSSAERSTVVYGHDARRGVVLEKYSRGLDSGCVRGGKLTAFVIEGGKKKAKQSYFHVKCSLYQASSAESAGKV